MRRRIEARSFLDGMARWQKGRLPSSVPLRPISGAHLRLIGRLAALLLLILALVLVSNTVLTVGRLHSALPVWDEWDGLALLRSLLSGEASLDQLFSQHNEHRIFFPRLVTFTDALFFGGRNNLNLIAIFVVQSLDAAMLIWLLVRTRVPLTGMLALTATILIMFFSLRQEENFFWGFQIAFVGVFALATLAFVLFSGTLTRLRDGRPYGASAVASFAAVAVATFTMANGLIAAAILVVLALVARARGPLVAASIAIAALLAALYFYGYHAPEQHTPLAFAIRHPLRLVTYVAVYLGGFLDPDIQAARVLGLGGLGAMAVACWRVVVAGDRDGPKLALFGIMLFAIGSAVVTAVGRVGFGVDQALSSRYVLGAATFWSASLVYWWTSASAWRRPLALRAAVSITAAVLVFGAVRSQFALRQDLEERAFQQRLATSALLLGVSDTPSFETIEDPGQPFAELVGFLKERRISIFGERDATRVGQNIREAGPIVDAGQCHGDVAEATIAPDLGRPNAARVSGQVWGTKGHSASNRLYLTRADGVIVGLATRHSRFTDPSSWQGFFVGPAGAPVHAYALLKDGGLCEIGTGTVSK